MMKTKILSILLLTALLSMSLVMATDFTISPTSLKFENNVNSLTFDLTPPTDTNNTNKYTFVLGFPTITLEDSSVVVFTYNATDLTDIETTAPITVTITSNADHNQLSIGKEYSGMINVTNDANSTDSKEITVNFVGSLCSMGEQGTDLEIKDIKINNYDGDDEDWSPLDKIEIEVEVENTGSEKIRDVMVELAVFDSNGKNIAKDLEDLDDEEIDLGSIKSDNDETAIFEFYVPADFDSGKYRLAIKVYSDDLGEENECTANSEDDFDDTYFQKIDGERESDEEKQVVFHDIKVTESPAQCRERVQVTGEIVNVGDEDYEDQLKVTLYNSELGLNLEQVVREDLEQGETESVEFEFEVPEGAEEKLYLLKFKTYYDYDEDDDSYDEESEEEFRTTLRVAGNCHVDIEDASITTELGAETPQAVAGKQVIIKSTVTNTGNKEIMYTLSVSGLDDWATLASIDDQVFTMAAGEVKDINIILNLDSDAEGDKEFTIKTTYGESGITEKKVPLSISASNAQLIPFVDNVKSNWFIYVIILVNVILIIAIISVIRSMVSPRPL